MTSLLFLCNILRKKWDSELIFCMQTSIKASYKLILWFLMGLANHSQISQNSTLAMSLQYLKKKIRDEVEFWHEDKHQSFLQVDFKTLGIRASYKIILSLLTGMIRSSHQRCPATSLKKRLWRRCFPVNFAKVLRTPFSQNTSGRLLLHDQAFS